MPYFVHGESRYKLTILHFVKEADLDITRYQVYRAMIENDCMSYFDFEQAMNELEEDGYVCAIPRTFGQGYRVTVLGERLLDMFAESLPYSLRKRLTAYADQSREEMRTESQLVTSMEELPSGAYRVRLCAQEDTRVVLDLQMEVASRDMAQRMRANWRGESTGVYLYLLKHLLKEESAQQAPYPGEGLSNAADPMERAGETGQAETEEAGEDPAESKQR